MQYQTSTSISSRWNRLLHAVAILIVSLLFGCATVKEENILDRTVVPEVRTDVPTTTSEIREIKFHTPKSEQGHKVIHLQGQIFTKTSVGGSTQITPCVGCSVKLTNATDSSAQANSITENDGYFTYNGAINFHTLTINGPGYNSVEIRNVNFDVGGINTMKVILAPGSTQERFMASKNGSEFTWTKLY